MKCPVDQPASPAPPVVLLMFFYVISARKVYFPSPVFCTDNGAIIAHVGRKYLAAGITSSLGLAPIANLELGPSDFKK